MLKMLEKSETISLEDARSKVPKQKAVFVIEDMSDMSNIRGYISCISENEDSYQALISEYNRIKHQDKQAIVIGSYENGGAIGVQYSI